MVVVLRRTSYLASGVGSSTSGGGGGGGGSVASKLSGDTDSPSSYHH